MSERVRTTLRNGVGASSSRPWPLRAYFIVLIAVFALTAAGATAYVFWQTGRDDRHDAERTARFAARTAAGQLGGAVAMLRATVKGVAATPGIARALTNPKACTLQFAGPPGLETGHIDVLRDSGSVACSSLPAQPGARPRSYRGAPWLRGASARPVFLAPVADPAVGGHAALAASPFKGGIVAAFLALEPAGAGLEHLYGGGRPVAFLVTTRTGTVIARSIEPRRWVGRSVTGTPFARAAGASERPDLDGRRRLYAGARVPGVPWTFSVGEDERVAVAAGARLRNRQLGIVLVGLALMLAVALAAYRRVAQPVTRLGTAVRSSSRRSPPVEVEASGPAEVVDLAADVNGLIRAVSDELAERQRAERSAQAAARNYRLLFESSPLPMWISDSRTGNMVEVNDAAVAHYGYTREEFLRLSMHDLEASPAEPADHAPNAVHRRKDGSQIKARVIARTITLGDRAVRFVMVEDVGEREQLEDQLRQAQRMEAIGRLAGGVAHDFNNLLTAILGNAELLLAHSAPGDPQHAEAEEVKKAGERAAALTRQLLTFGRSQAREPVVLDINDVVAGLEAMLRRLIRSDVAIVSRLSDGPTRIRADRGQMEQVIVNLVVNAGDAMPGGGRLTLATARVELDEEYFRLHPAGNGAPGRYVELEVADTGVGMDADTLSHIFEPFFTTKGSDHGTGLGLATVYWIVRQNGGFVWAYSEPGLGTSFKVYLPLVDAPIDLEPATRPPATLAASGREVLLVEDDPAVRTIVRRMLERDGFAIVEAAEGQEALALSGERDPDSLGLLVTDTIMPGPGGIELAEHVRRRHPALRTLIMSGYNEPPTSREALKPATEFIAKPFTATDLRAKLAQLLEA